MDVREGEVKGEGLILLLPDERNGLLGQPLGERGQGNWLFTDSTVLHEDTVEELLHEEASFPPDEVCEVVISFQHNSLCYMPCLSVQGKVLDEKPRHDDAQDHSNQNAVSKVLAVHCANLK